MKYSDLIRKHVEQHAVEPALRAGQKEFSIVSGDVHRALGFQNRVPLVCQALRSKQLLRNNNLILKSESGPPSGLSTTMIFTYRFAQPGAQVTTGVQKTSALRGLIGRGKQLWSQWGGGEAFLERERASFEKKENE